MDKKINKKFDNKPNKKSNKKFTPQPKNSLMADQLKAALNKKHEEDEQLIKQEKDVFLKKAKEIREFLEKTYPKAFNRKDFKPLKIGIHKDLLEKHPDLFDPPQHLKYFIKNHTGQVGYSYQMLNATHRVDLDGKEVSEIQDSERQHAQKLKSDFNKMRREKFIDTLYKNHPKCFFREFRKRKPLCQKIIEQIKEKHPKINDVLIQRAIGSYTSNYSYHENINKSSHAINLNGEQAEEISKQQKEEAVKTAKELREKIHSKNLSDKNPDNKALDNKPLDKNISTKKHEPKLKKLDQSKAEPKAEPKAEQKDQEPKKPDSKAKT